jgi:hypothetical protein
MFKATAVGVLLSALLLLSGCNKPLFGTNGCTAAIDCISLSSRFGNHCKLGFEVYANNSGSTRVTVQIRVLRKDGGNTTESTTSVTVDPGAEAYVGCEQTEDGVVYDYYKVSAQFALRAPNGDTVLVASLPPRVEYARFDAAATAPVQPCTVECNNLGPRCLRVTSKLPDDNRRGLDWLSTTLLATADQEIAQDAIVKAFKLPAKDVGVNRGTTRISAWNFNNGGPASLVKVSLNKNSVLSIHLPAVIAGSITQRSATDGTITFAPDESPTVSFTDTGMEKRWGGTVEEITINGSTLYATTKNACFMAETLH